jgi:hypothetical protein
MNNFALHSFNQNYYINNFALHSFSQKKLYINIALRSSNQKPLIQTASHCVTWFVTTSQQKFHTSLIGQSFRTAVDHVTLSDSCSRRRNRVTPGFTVSSQPASVRTYVTVGEWVAERIDIDPTDLKQCHIIHTHTRLVTFRSKAPGVQTTSCLKVRWQNTP